MSIEFFPLGIPFSSSYAARATYTETVAVTPVTASLAEYIITYVGPTGSVYQSVSASALI